METIEQRTKAALDNIANILMDMSLDEQGRLPIQGLLDDTGSICERKGFEPAVLFVIGKKKGSTYEDRQEDLDRFVGIIKVLQQHKLPRSEASYVVKKLNAIKQFYIPERGG